MIYKTASYFFKDQSVRHTFEKNLSSVEKHEANTTQNDVK